MFIVFLKLAGSREQVTLHLDAHKSWLQQGFADGAFLLAGSLGDGTGGCILAVAESLADLQSRVDKDPFVRENVVQPEIISFNPSVADERLAFLVD